jgi:hypothetical protein
MPATSVADSSRAIVVIGMHRSGTSAVARGLAALGVDLGDDFLNAQPENPTGYWEDRGIVELNERVLKTLGLKWDDCAPIDVGRFSGWRMWRLRRETIRYLQRKFALRPLWGFKDPRTIRLLPFWLQALRQSRVEDAYLLVIRNPASVAASLHARQGMTVAAAQRLWLSYTVPFFDSLEAKPLVVVDYDLLMGDPRGQLTRIARKLELASAASPQVESFVNDFLDAKLRHTVFSANEIDTSTEPGRLTRRAYGMLREIAEDRRAIDDAFWKHWKEFKSSFDSSQDDTQG